MKLLRHTKRIARNVGEAFSQDNKETLTWSAVLMAFLFIVSELVDMYIFIAGGLKP